MSLIGLSESSKIFGVCILIFLVPLRISGSCGTDLDNIVLLQELTSKKSANLIDYGSRVYHMVHSESDTFKATGGIMYNSSLTRLNQNFDLAIFELPIIYSLLLTITSYHNFECTDCSSYTVPSEQIILKKLTSTSSIALEVALIVISGQANADLRITSGSSQTTISNFFTHQTAIRIGLERDSYGAIQIYQDQTYVGQLSSSIADDATYVKDFYLGGNLGSPCSECFLGILNGLYIWSVSGMSSSYPISTLLTSKCGSELFYSSNFPDGWPDSTLFGNNWVFVRRLAPAYNWGLLKDEDGNPIVGENLDGNGKSQSINEKQLFYTKSPTTSESGTRYYSSFTFDTYLIVAGDFSGWIQFSKSDLLTAISDGQTTTCVNLLATTHLESSPHNILIKFDKSPGANILIGFVDIDCSDTTTGDGNGPIYGEISDSSDTSILTNNLFGRKGAAVFVRNSDESNVYYCGDAIRTIPEECDDGNTVSGDGCDSQCKIELKYECVGGDYNNHEIDLCSLNEFCGDGIIKSGEECDDINNNDDDGCSSSCTLELTTPDRYTYGAQGYFYYIGNGNYAEVPCNDLTYLTDPANEAATVEYWKRRKYFSNNNKDMNWYTALLNTFFIDPILNDEYKTPREYCDDGNTDREDGHAFLPFYLNRCQDGQIEIGWSCSEDVNEKSTCTEICGDGYRYVLECDDNNTDDGDGCSSSCTIEDGWELADTTPNQAYNYFLGYNIGNKNKPKADEMIPICGDGLLRGDEECDDGNLDNLDGCHSNCKIEEGWNCVLDGETSVCTEICGDGYKYYHECDDGNTDNLDGCSSNCEIERGWYLQSSYRNQPYDYTTNYNSGTRYDPKNDVLINICGDGIKVSNEECDDENTIDGDGCSSSCEIEDNYVCKYGTLTTRDYCALDEPLTAVISFINSTSKYFNLIFNKPIRQYYQSKIEELIKSMEIYILENEDDTDKYYFKKFDVEAIDDTVLEVTFDVTKSISKNYILYVNFTDSIPYDMILDEMEITYISAYTFSTSVDDKYYQTPETNSIGTTGVVTTIVSGICFMSFLLTGSSLSGIWAMSSLMQLLTFFSFINVRIMPEILIEFYNTMSIAFLEFLPNIVALLLPEENADNLNLTDNARYHPCLDGKNFYINIGNTLLGYVVIALVYPLIIILSKYGGMKQKKYFQKKREDFEWSGLFRSFIMLFVEVVLAGFIHLRYITFTGNFFDNFSTASAILLTLLSYISIFFIGRFIRKNRKNLEDEAFTKKYGSLYSEYESTGLQKYTILIFLIRRLVALPLMVMFNNYPEIQITTFFVTTLFFGLGWNILVKPRREKIFKYNDIISEVLVLIIGGMFYSLLDDSFTKDDFDMRGNAIFYLMEILIGINLVVMTLHQILTIRNKINKSDRSKKFELKDESTLHENVIKNPVSQNFFPNQKRKSSFLSKNIAFLKNKRISQIRPRNMRIVEYNTDLTEFKKSQT